MKRRYEAATVALGASLGFRPAAALREVLSEGYTLDKLRSDVLAGMVVGIVALPLSMALAIASGVPPQHGLYTAIVAGGVTAVLGGSRTQVSGPTAAFVVLLAPVSAKYGLGGLVLASMMAGVILIGLGAARMGRLIQYIPYPVTAGFTAGIAVVIATLQLKDLFGLTVASMPEHYVERVQALATAAPSFRVADLGLGAFTLAVLLLWPRVSARFPAPLVALALAAVAGTFLDVATIGSRFSYIADGVTRAGIPQVPPVPGLPWSLPGADGAPVGLSLPLLRALLPSAFAIAMLGAIESLLSAVVADGMAGTKHDPDAELIAQGAGNVVAPFFGGFAATGALARTATNVRAGARSPVSAVVHSLVLLLSVLLLAPALSYLPMAALAALLLIVAWNMSEAKHFVHVLRVAPKSDVTVLLACFSLTILFDMVVAVSVGVVLASFLFMRRMAEISGARLSEGDHAAMRDPLPKGVVFYEINGPLFFGAAQKAMGALEETAGRARVVVLDVQRVPAMDATGLVNLESAMDRLHRHNVLVVLTGVQPQPEKVLHNAGFEAEEGRLAFASSVHEALEIARAHLAGAPHDPGRAAG